MGDCIGMTLGVMGDTSMVEPTSPGLQVLPKTNGITKYILY